MNPSQVSLTNFTFTGFTGTAPTQLNLYANSNRTGLLTSSISNSGFSYTFDGLTALTFGTEYYAFYPSDINISNPGAFNNPYTGGAFYSNGVIAAGGILDSTFTATLSATPAAAVPFEFEPTGAVVILGGLWGLKRWVNKKRQA